MCIMFGLAPDIELKTLLGTIVFTTDIKAVSCEATAFLTSELNFLVSAAAFSAATDKRSVLSET